MELLQERAEGVLWLTMNRPEVLNALGGNMMWDLLSALGAAAMVSGVDRTWCWLHAGRHRKELSAERPTASP